MAENSYSLQVQVQDSWHHALSIPEWAVRSRAIASRFPIKWLRLLCHLLVGRAGFLSCSQDDTTLIPLGISALDVPTQMWYHVDPSGPPGHSLPKQVIAITQESDHSTESEDLGADSPRLTFRNAVKANAVCRLSGARGLELQAAHIVPREPKEDGWELVHDVVISRHTMYMESPFNEARLLLSEFLSDRIASPPSGQQPVAESVKQTANLLDDTHEEDGGGNIDCEVEGSTDGEDAIEDDEEEDLTQLPSALHEWITAHDSLQNGLAMDISKHTLWDRSIFSLLPMPNFGLTLDDYGPARATRGSKTWVPNEHNGKCLLIHLLEPGYPPTNVVDDNDLTDGPPTYAAWVENNPVVPIECQTFESTIPHQTASETALPNRMLLDFRYIHDVLRKWGVPAFIDKLDHFHRAQTYPELDIAGQKSHRVRGYKAKQSSPSGGKETPQQKKRTHDDHADRCATRPDDSFRLAAGILHIQYSRDNALRSLANEMEERRQQATRDRAKRQEENACRVSQWVDSIPEPATFSKEI